jgi:uncharacterized protein
MQRTATAAAPVSADYREPVDSLDEPIPDLFEGQVKLRREACMDLLQGSSVGRLAVTLPNGEPVIRPVNYAFDARSQSVVFRTAAGSKFQALIRSRRAAFEIDGVDPVEHTGWSVIIQGVSEEITDPTEIERLEELRLEDWWPFEKPHWFRVRAYTVSGRQVLGSGAAAGERD